MCPHVHTSISLCAVRMHLETIVFPKAYSNRTLARQTALNYACTAQKPHAAQTRCSVWKVLGALTPW